jgi:tripartite-type tricarboxylate transporter receptor subunit TctC
MKKLLSTLLLAAMAFGAQAKETITVVYAFGVGDPMANYDRALVAEANKVQDKYTFLFDVKPGAGSSIAANYVKNTPNTVLATSGAFFVRPVFYPNESHSVADFKGIMPQCDDSMSIASSKYKTIKDIPTDKPLNMAITGLGVVSHLIAVKFTEKYPNVTLIPYKSPTEAIAALMGGQVDFAIGYVGDQERLSTEKTPIHVLGVTGQKPVNGHPTLASGGLSKLLEQSDNPNQLFVPATWSQEKYKEVRAILVQASNTKSVRDAYASNYCKSLDQMSDKAIDQWFANQDKHWKKLGEGVKIN